MIFKPTVNIKITLKMITILKKMNLVKTSQSNQQANWIQGIPFQIIKIMIIFKSLLINLN